jgi:hypothetical protein
MVTSRSGGSRSLGIAMLLGTGAWCAVVLSGDCETGAEMCCDGSDI